MKPHEAAAAAAEAAAAAQRSSWAKVMSAALRVARDVDIAEESTADAFALALEAWTTSGVPASVEAWLLTVARRRAIDRVRRACALRDRLPTLARDIRNEPGVDVGFAGPPVPDDDLRLVVLCCHPALAAEAQVALTLRLGCGVSTAAVANAFLVPEATMAARLTRAKRRIVESGVGIDLPDDVAVEERMPAVRRTLHLAYTLGHTAAAGVGLRDDAIAGRALHLARVLHASRPDDSEVAGLLALILLTEARASGRFDDGGHQVLFADADRRLWDAALLDEGRRVLGRIDTRSARTGPLVLHALIAAERMGGTGDKQSSAHLLELYDRLLVMEPSPTVALGRCLAVAAVVGADAGLADLDEVIVVGRLGGYPYAHAARAHLLEQLGRADDAASAWHAAASTARTDAERTHFEARQVRVQRSVRRGSRTT